MERLFHIKALATKKNAPISVDTLKIIYQTLMKKAPRLLGKELSATHDDSASHRLTTLSKVFDGFMVA